MAVGIILLFIGISITTSIDATHSIDGKDSDECYPLFKGTPGKNGWFVSPLIVSFIYDPENVTEIQYLLYGMWEPYDGSFNITQTGELPLFKWRYRTIMSGDEWIYDQTYCPFLPDFNPPSLHINIERKGFFFGKRYIITADARDNLSGMDYVEFYLNGQLRSNVTGPGPLYEWTLRPVPRRQNLIFKVCAYDVAGNSIDYQIFKSNVYSNDLLIQELLYSWDHVLVQNGMKKGNAKL